jgi:UDP-glucose 4-epimerase
VRTIWITGAAGFIGTMLSSLLVREGDRCFGLDVRAAERSSIETAQFVTGAVSEPALAALLDLSGPPDAVFHLAGGSAVGPSFSDPAADFAATAGSTSLMLDFLRRRAPSAIVVLPSSAAVYGSDHDGAIAETASPHPVSPYGAHKLIMEALADSYGRFFGLDIRVARLFSVYGRGLRKQLLWDLCGKLAAGGGVVTLGGTGQELRDFIHGADVARALRTLSLPDVVISPAVVNIGSGQASSVKLIADTVASSWQERTGRAAFIEFNGDSRPGDPASLFAATARMQTLGFAPEISLEAGLRDYVDWYLADAGLKR